MPDDCAFKNCVVLQQTILNLVRRDKDAADFEHVVGAPVIPVITIRVEMKLITGRAPVAGKSLFRFFMRVPVTQRG